MSRLTAASVIKAIERQEPELAKLVVMATAQNAIMDSMLCTTIAAFLANLVCGANVAIVVAGVVQLAIYGIISFSAYRCEKLANGDGK